MKPSVLAFLFTMAAMSAACKPPAQKPSSEPSIKPNASGGSMNLSLAGGRLSATNITLRQLLQRAYRPVTGQLPYSEIIGAPSWMDTEHFDIKAKLGATNFPSSAAELAVMIKPILEDGFQLKTHHEMRDLPILRLTTAKGGLKLRLSKDQKPPTVATRARSSETPTIVRECGFPTLGRGGFEYTSTSSGMAASGNAVPIATLINRLEVQLGQHIIDNTDARGLFDFCMRFNPEGLLIAVTQDGRAQPHPTPRAPLEATIFTALKEQLGLKLESARGPVEVLVIDSVQKPSEN